MNKILIISNRLPVTVRCCGNSFKYIESIGGLSTGIKSYHENSGGLWVGWPGLNEEEMSPTQRDEVQHTLLEKYKCLPVLLSENEVRDYYLGFCNDTLWPLFHYFTSKTQYDPKTWEAYKAVNRKFFEAVCPYIDDGDMIWIHDYQLMLLPEMIKEKFPDTKIGFFLHIPFPSFEVFRLLIWREEILHGILGADLIGFHTYDYVRHFMSSTRRLLGLEDNLNTITFEDRCIRVDAFPMGIDYEKFSRQYDNTELAEERLGIEEASGTRTILSVDRLDYTKGIPQRIKTFSRFLSMYPKYRGKVRWILIVAPSRVELDSYDSLLREIKEKVSEINGKYGTLHWMPIWFFFRSFTQEDLIVLYRHSDVLLVTPLRDGMNLVAKEYIAARTDFDGMVVISETAGAASELAEAVIVNANDSDAIAQGLKNALDMTLEEKISRNKVMRRRLERYDIKFWANEFLTALEAATFESACAVPQVSLEKEGALIERAYESAKKRILFLDYDGTLVGFKSIPDQAKPDNELRDLLKKLTADPKNTVVIVSGRDRPTLESWLGDINRLHLIASHGLWLRYPYGEDWIMTSVLGNKWKDTIRPILELYSDRMPGALVEEKEFSLAWHYRQCDPDMAGAKLNELKETLLAMISTSSLMLQEGNKVLEIKDGKVNKGQIASLLVQNLEHDFVLGAGDDHTDEDLFVALPSSAYSIKIGSGKTAAQYRLKSWQSMRRLLERLAEIGGF